MNVKFLKACVLTYTLICTAQAQAPTDVRIALVVGNAAYAPPAELANPENDAKAMAASLRRLGFEVFHLSNASREQLVKRIQETGDALRGKRGIGMLYYAGHGVQLDWRNYMVPVDAQIANSSEIPVKSVDVNLVLEAFRSAGNRMNIVVLDACRNNPFSESGSPVKGLAPLDAPPGTILAYATAPGNVADDGANGNGLYTQHLLAELSRPDTRIEDVFKRTRFAVRRASAGKQIPWEATSLEEDFVFSADKVLPAPKLDEQARTDAFDREAMEWGRIKASNSATDFYEFLSRFPSGSFSEMASLRLADLQRPVIQAQATSDGVRESDFLNRYRNGDRYSIVWRDGLTGRELSRSVYELREMARGEFQTVTISGAPYEVRVLATGHTVRDRLGTYDPPVSTVPGAEFKIGNRSTMRSIVIGPQGGKGWIDFESRVVGRESIDTALGNLLTYRIEATAFTQNGSRIVSTSWFDPAWGQAVRTKTEVRGPSGGAPDVRIRDVISRSRAGQ